MATYTDANGVKLITTGDEAGTWGSSTNVNLQILDRAANGFESIALSATSYTLALSAQPSSAENGHYKAIKFTGTPGGTCTVTLAQNDKARMYMLLNSTNQALIITQGSGANVTIEVGKGSIVLADGAGSGAAVTDFTAAVQNVTDLSSPFNVGATSVTTSGAELNLLDGSAAGTIANSKAVIYGSSGEVNATTLQIAGTSITATAAELNYVDGVTSAIQTQIDAKQPLGTVAVTVAGGKFVIDGTSQQTVELKPSVTYRFDQSDSSNSNHPLRFSTNDNNSPSAPFTTGVTTAGTPGNAGAYTQVKLEQDAPAVLYYYCSNHSGMGGKAIVRMSDFTASRALISDSGGDIAVSGVTTTELDILDGLTASTAELNIMDGVTATTSELNIMDGVTATTAELNYVDGVTSAIQTQINSKQATITGAATTIDDADLTASRAVVSNSSGKVAVSAVTATELGYLDGVTSAIQTQIDSKQGTLSLTASRALVSDSGGSVNVSPVTSTEIGYLDGVTSSIQTQIDSKINGTSLNASNLDSGTVNDARLPASISSDITGNAATATTAAALTGNVTKSGDFTIDSSGDIILDADGGDYILKDGGTTRGKISVVNTASLADKVDFYAGSGTGLTDLEMRINTTGVNVSGGLRVGDLTTPSGTGITAQGDITTAGDVVAVSDVTAATGNVSAGGEIKLTGGAQDWTFEVDGSNRLVIQYNGTSLARIDTSGNLVVAGDVTSFGSL